MELHLIDRSEIIESKWGGGVTYQLFISPNGASYAERRFESRISTAVVELEESSFTALPGVTRFLTPLCEEGFELSFNGGGFKKLPFGGVLCFEGGENVVCRGSGQDLNLMLKGRRGDMRCVYCGEGFSLPEAEFVFVYALEAQRLACAETGESFTLPEGGFARLTGAGSLRSSGRLVMFCVY